VEQLPAGVSLFFIQLLVILAVARLVGALALKLGQPRVVGEMIAGILLGPTLFGALAPQLQAQLFAADYRPVLNLGAQIGIGLYMFLVGLEFDTSMFKAKARSAVAISLSGILMPFIMACVLATWLVAQGGLFADTISWTQAMLFLGASIGITAFPMLARVIQEQGLANSKLGTLVLAAGAIDDVAAWCLMALLLASFSGDDSLFIRAVLGAVIFAGLMLTLVRKQATQLEAWYQRETRLTPRLLLVILLLWVFAVTTTEWIGLHAVFGGFVLGVVMPRGLLAEHLVKRLQPVVLIALVPLFFTVSGLKTDLSLLAQGTLWQVALAVIAASIFAKAVACYLAARLCGENHPMALSVGILMNARGMMELILLNIALQNGVIKADLFSVLVLMTIVTTMMATPLFNFLQRRPSFRQRLQ
jgi:Kef-type K+ transport system membrane component KefB